MTVSQLRVTDCDECHRRIINRARGETSAVYAQVMRQGGLDLGCAERTCWMCGSTQAQAARKLFSKNCQQDKNAVIVEGFATEEVARVNPNQSARTV